MKSRDSLVSNSSSTSFMIAYRDSKPCIHCGRKDFDVVKLVETIETYGYSDRNKVEARGISDVKNYITCIWGNEGEAEDNGEKLLKKICDYEKQGGWEFAVIKVSYGNEEVRAVLNDGFASGNIVDLYNSES